MNNNGWIKLHRKAKESEIFFDESAWRVFTWLLMTVDRTTGKLTTGRFVLAENLRLKSTTLYKILKRLEKKYDLVTLVSNNRFTTISVKNWAKYQSEEDSVTQESNNKVTTKGQQSNNKVTLNKNIRNKEYIYDQEKNEVTRSAKNSVVACTEQELWEIAYSLKASLEDVKRTHDTILDKIANKDFKYKTVYYTLRTWVRNNIERGTYQTLDGLQLTDLKDMNPFTLKAKTEAISRLEAMI